MSGNIMPTFQATFQLSNSHRYMHVQAQVTQDWMCQELCSLKLGAERCNIDVHVALEAY